MKPTIIKPIVYIYLLYYHYVVFVFLHHVRENSYERENCDGRFSLPTYTINSSTASKNVLACIGEIRNFCSSSSSEWMWNNFWTFFISQRTQIIRKSCAVHQCLPTLCRNNMHSAWYWNFFDAEHDVNVLCGVAMLYSCRTVNVHHRHKTSSSNDVLKWN